jgi:hypothetical protein
VSNISPAIHRRFINCHKTFEKMLKSIAQIDANLSRISGASLPAHCQNAAIHGLKTALEVAFRIP